MAKVKRRPMPKELKIKSEVPPISTIVTASEEFLTCRALKQSWGGWMSGTNPHLSYLVPKGQCGIVVGSSDGFAVVEFDNNGETVTAFASPSYLQQI